MGSIDDFSELCRLCLVKDQVNIPIFDETSDIGQTFLKIESCLPVKVSRDDNLPKKICDGCSYKLDMLYIFRNTSIDSEKQLISWLSQAGLSTTSKDPLATTTKPEIMVKQETFEPSDTRVDGDSSDLGVDAHSYMMQQQQLPYQQDFDFGEPSSSAARLSDEPSPKRAKRAAALKKAPIEETEEDEEEDLDAAMQITKAEDEDSEDADQPDYVEAPSTSADDQPGPSGVGKGAVEAPLTNNVRFVCNVCSRQYPTYPKLRKHMYVHREKTNECVYCDKRFAYKNDLKTHVKWKHENRRDFKCDGCAFSTKTPDALRKHKISQHSKNFPFRCGLCYSGFLTKNQLENHQKVAHGGQRYICSKCGVIFKSETSLKKHLQKHAGHVQPGHQCEICGKKLMTHSGFLCHIANHNGDGKSFNCEECGRFCSSLKSLNDHLKVHRGIKNHVCEVCGKAFSRRQLLVVHGRVHTGEKPYECMECWKCFAQKPALDTHMKYHTGERPHRCHICRKEFVTKSLMKRHICQI